MSLGQKLWAFGKTKFTTKKEFAGALGMSYENLYQYLTDKAKPGPELITRLVEIGCNLNWLFFEAENYKYRPIEKEEILDPVPKYKILGSVPAGIADINEYNDWPEYDDLYYDPRTHFYLKVDEEFGYSMMPIVNPGDRVLVSINGKVKDGDLVAALWDKTKGALKILSINPDLPNVYVLTSYNQAIKPIFISKNLIKLYKVVLIQKRN